MNKLLEFYNKEIRLPGIKNQIDRTEKKVGYLESEKYNSKYHPEYASKVSKLIELEDKKTKLEKQLGIKIKCKLRF